MAKQKKASQPPELPESWEKPPRRRRRWPIVVGVIAGVVVVLVAFAPVLIASLGRGTIVGAINDTIKGTVAIDSLSLSWFGPQKVTGIELLDPDGQRVATVKDVTTELSLWSAIWGDMNLGKTVIAGVEGDVKVAADGSTNLQKAIESRKPPTDEPTRVPPTLAIDAELRDAKVTVTPAGGAPAEFNDLSLTAALPSVAEPMTVKLAGKTRQGDVSGSFDGDATVTGLFAADGLLTADKASANAKLNATDVPAAGLDGLLALGGLLAEAVGDKLNASVIAEGTAASQTATVTIASPRLSGVLKAKLAGAAVSLTEPARIELLATPGLASNLARRRDAASKLTLAAPTKLVLTIDAFSAPAGPFDPARTAVRARLAAEQPIAFTGDPAIGDATLSNFAASVDAPSIADAVNLAVNADLLVDGQPGKIAVNGDLRNLFTPDGKPQYDKLTPDLVVSIQNLPTALVDRFMPADALKAPLAEMIGPTLNIDATARSAAAGRIDLAPLSIRSQRLNAQLPLTITDRITSAAPGSIAYDMPRSVAVAYGLTEKNLAFDEITQVRIINLAIDAPRPAEGAPAFQPDKTKVNGDLTLSNVTYNLDESTHVTLSNLVAKLTGDSLAAAKVHATTAAILANGSDRISRFTGRKADVTLAATVAVPAGDAPVTADDVTLVVTSDVMKLTALAQLTADTLSLKRPATLDYTLTQKLLDDLGAWPTDYPPLAGPTPITMTVTKLTAPMPFDIAKLDVEANGTLTPAQGNDPLGELFGGPVAITLKQGPRQAVQAETLPPFELTVKSERVDLSAGGELALAEPRQAKLAGRLSATITPKLVAMLKLVEPGATTIAEPTTATAFMEQTTLPLSGFDVAKLKTKLTAEFDRIALTSGGGGGGQVDGTVITGLKTVEPLAFDGPAGTMSVKLTGGALAKGQTGEPSPIVADVKMSKLITDGKLAFASAAIDADVNVRKLPTAVVDAIANQGGKLEPVIGPTVDLTARVNTTGGAATRGTATINASGENLVASADLKLADGLVTLARPATFKWTLTPVAYAALTKPATPTDGTEPQSAALALTEPGVISGTIDSLSYPLPTPGSGAADAPPKPTDWSKVAFNAMIASPSLKLLDTKTNKPVTISDLSAKASSTSMASGLTATTTAKLATTPGSDKTGGAVQAGDVRIAARLTELFDAAGAFNKAGLSADVDAKVTGIPGSLASAITGSAKMAALIGDRGDVAARVKLQRMQGPVAIAVDAQNTKANIDGRIADGYFTLNKDADATITITEGLADLKIGASVVDVLAGMLFDNPLMKQAVKSVEPMRVRVGAEGFRVPVTDFALDKVQVAKMTVNPGKLLVENAGLINTLVLLPQTVTRFKGGEFGGLLKRMGSKEVVEAWFTDMPVSVRDGVVRMGRMDMLLGENYQVAVWGDLNLSDKPRQVDGKTMPAQHGRMILGLAERAMRRVYGISRFKGEPSYVDQFVMEGPIATLGPDPTELKVRIAALTAVGATGGGDQAIKILEGVGAILKETGIQKKSGPAPPAPQAPWPPEEEPAADATQPADGAQPAPDEPKAAQPTQPTKPPKKKSDTEKALDALEGLLGK